MNSSYLGELHLKVPNQDNEYLQRQKFNLFDNQDSLVPFRTSSTVNFQKQKNK
jgi:hypothetical protein